MAVKKNQKKLVESWKALFYGKNKYVDQALNDSSFRLQVTTRIGSIWNLIYALFHFVLAVHFQSFWFLTMGLYYFLICCLRVSALLLHNNNELDFIKTLKTNAILTFILAIVFFGIVFLTISEKHNQIYDLIVALIMALYTFYSVISAILNLTRLKNDNTPEKVILRNSSMVYALGSLFGLESMMLGTFGDADNLFTLEMEAMSGTIIFIMIIIFGLNFLMLYKKHQLQMKSSIVTE